LAIGGSTTKASAARKSIARRRTVILPMTQVELG